MILFTRVEARDFHTLLSRCVSGRPRGPAPVLLIRFANGTRTIASTSPDGVLLTHTTAVASEQDELLVVPGSVLAEVEGSTDEGVKLDRHSKLRGVLHWHTGSKPRTLPVELILPGKQHTIPTPPVFSAVPPQIFAALQECGRSAAKENGRLALSRIQLQGKHGRVVGTDGKVALLWSGFEFPFSESLLVPALPVFHAKPLVRVENTRVGRTSTHLVLAVGPWSIWLPIDSTSKYPDVAGVIPKHPPTSAVIDKQDVVELLKALPTLPGNDDENRPVTLDVAASVRVRGRVPGSGETKEITLTRSRSTGPHQSVALDRRALARVLSLGCRRLQLTPDKPFLANGDNITFVAAPLDPASIVPASTADRNTAPDEAISSSQHTPTVERSSSMKPEANGQHVAREDPSDPLVVAEELRAALTEATTKATRLVAVLKAGRKEKKVLASLYAGLKQLNLDVPNGQV